MTKIVGVLELELGNDVFTHFPPADAKKLLIDLEEQVKALEVFQKRVLGKIEALEG